MMSSGLGIPQVAPGALGGLSYPQLRTVENSIGTNILASRFVNSAGVLGSTFHVMARMAVEFDAVRIILCNGTVANVINVTACACAGGSTSDPLQSSATWTNATFAGASSVTLPLSADSNNPTYTFTDWIPLRGDSSRLLSARVYIPSAGNTTCPVYSDGTLTDWVSGVPDEEWIARYQTGDFVTTPASMNSVSNRDNSAILGFQYMARGAVTTVIAMGDSIASGIGALISDDSFTRKAVRQMRGQGAKVEFANLGWSGQTSTQIYTRAAVVVPLIKPTVMVYSAFSPNDGAPTAALDVAMRKNFGQAVLLARDQGVHLIPLTGLPRAASRITSNWTVAQDAFRKLFNQENVRARPNFADIASVLSFSESPLAASYYKFGTTNDFIHPNEQGNVLAAAPVAAALSAFLT